MIADKRIYREQGAHSEPTPLSRSTRARTTKMKVDARSNVRWVANERNGRVVCRPIRDFHRLPELGGKQQCQRDVARRLQRNCLTAENENTMKLERTYQYVATLVCRATQTRLRVS